MRAGSGNAITDVSGVRVGHHHRLDEHWATGTTVVLTTGGATAAVDVRGGGPGTRETDVLTPSHMVQRVHAVTLTGGSAYGLAAADGVMRWLGERGHGFGVGEPGQVVPIVPAAVLFDLPMGDWGNRPDAEFGYLACESAGLRVARGNVGAGTGAVAGSLKGGIGTASAVLPDGGIVGALMAVNSSGSVVDPDTGLPWTVTTGEFGLNPPSRPDVEAARPDGRRPGRHGFTDRPLNTTIGVVATDRSLTKPACQRVAVAAHDGLARAIRPAHALTDGDTVFAVATGRDAGPEVGGAEWIRGLDELCAVAADVVAAAIVDAVLNATSLGAVPCYLDRYPSASE